MSAPATPGGPDPRPAGGRRRILVVGSYAPVPTAGAAVTLDLVRSMLADGDRPVVVSPRASAAHFEVPVTGVLAGRRLRRLRVLTGATALVLVAEPELPVPAVAPRPELLGLVQRRSVGSVLDAAHEFDRFTLVLADDLDIDPAALGALTAGADEVVDLRGRHHGTPGVTVLGPGAHDPVRLALTTTGKVARRVLAPLPAPARNAVYAVGRAGIRQLTGRRRR